MPSDSIAVLDAEIAALRKALDRVSSDFAAARDDLAKNGVQCMVIVLDSHGSPVTKLGISPSVKVLAACERTGKILTAALSAAEQEKKKLLAPVSSWSRFAPHDRPLVETRGADTELQ